MRAVLLVIDSFGLGALPDAHLYGDAGANTALHICEALPAPKWPHLKELGLGNCAALLGHHLPGCEPVEKPAASFGVMMEASPGKDTTTGHWELAGLKLTRPFHTFGLSYPSFPADLVTRLQNRTGYTLIGNKGASGTRIIQELGEAHMNGKGLIVYTSADSVMQIAAHEDIVSVQALYTVCEIARDLCDAYHVGRVIARPFTGRPGCFVRTRARKDFSMAPPEPTLLDHLQNHQGAARPIETVGIGKIGDIFKEQGLTLSFHDSGNSACMDRILDEMGRDTGSDRLLFVNLVDTDMHFGHRRDIKGYRDAVQAIDDTLPALLACMKTEDLLIITADHGCDPGFIGTDHTREYVPLLVCGKQGIGQNLGIRTSFCDVAQSLAAFFGIKALVHGTSFLHKRRINKESMKKGEVR